jgi:hypothetical protein
LKADPSRKNFWQTPRGRGCEEIKKPDGLEARLVFGEREGAGKLSLFNI